MSAYKKRILGEESNKKHVSKIEKAQETRLRWSEGERDWEIGGEQIFEESNDLLPWPSPTAFTFAPQAARVEFDLCNDQLFKLCQQHVIQPPPSN